MISLKFEIETTQQTFTFSHCDLEAFAVEPKHFSIAVERLLNIQPNIPASAIKSVKILETF